VIRGISNKIAKLYDYIIELQFIHSCRLVLDDSSYSKTAFIAVAPITADQQCGLFSVYVDVDNFIHTGGSGFIGDDFPHETTCVWAQTGVRRVWRPFRCHPEGTYTD
jgi:hypothetical protein